MRNFFLSILLLALYGGSGEAGDAPLEVHEWGVWVRDTVQVKPYNKRVEDLKPGAPQNLLATPREATGDLPGFVGRHSSVYKPKQIEVRQWRKPVIHLYGPEALEVEIKVLTPQGNPTEYWPIPAFLESQRMTNGVGASEAVGLIWKGTLSATAPKNLPEAPAKHWWQTVREVPSAYLKTEAGSERFVFYEATALQEPTVTARVAKDSIVLKNAHNKSSAQVLLILNDGKEVRWQGVKAIPAGGEVSITRENFFAPRKQNGTLLEDCEHQWQSFGLTKEEAHAIVETWREDLETRYGFLLISRMPEDLYDKMFPLTVTPKPDKIVRAGAVFDTLTGQDARADWLPRLQDDLQAWAKELRHEEFDVRSKAQAKLAQVDTLAKPLLERLAAEKDPETAAAAKLLLKRLEPAIVDQPLGVPGNLTPVERK